MRTVHYQNMTVRGNKIENCVNCEISKRVSHGCVWNAKCIYGRYHSLHLLLWNIASHKRHLQSQRLLCGVINLVLVHFIQIYSKMTSKIVYHVIWFHADRSPGRRCLYLWKFQKY